MSIYERNMSHLNLDGGMYQLCEDIQLLWRHGANMYAWHWFYQECDPLAAISALPVG